MSIISLAINIPAFVDSLGIMVMGMLGIFAVTAVIILGICILNKLTK